MNKKEFSMRRYDKQELAMLYARARKRRGRINQDTANRYFRRMLMQCTPILPELYAIILGHRDLPGVKKACPCFNASAEYGRLFE